MLHPRALPPLLPLALILALLSATVPVQAQTNTGTVSGEIRDPSGAVVVGARIRLIDVQTDVERQALSNEAGFYKFPLVPNGNYRLVTEASGFKSVTVQGIHIDVNQNLTVPVTLEVGQVSETIAVTGSAQLVDTVSGSVKEVVDEARVRELPLNGRNVLQLQQLVNGALYAGSGDQQANTPAFQVNGGTLFTNNYTLDGGEHSDSFFNSAITFPNPDAIQEFSIQTSSYSAEYGRNRGATVNAVTRSGTNNLHGSLFEFVRNNAFDARDFFAPRGVPPFKRNQFGATLGGPVIRNKTFFFFAWETTRERGAPSVATFQTLSPAMRSGNFSELPKPISDPLTGQPFPGNLIPVNRLSAPALNFLNKYTPLPTLPNRLFSGFQNGSFNRDQYIGRVDH